MPICSGWRPITAGDDAGTQLRERGVALLRGIFPADSLLGLRAAAERLFEAVGAGNALPRSYRFNRFSHSMLLTALVDFDCSLEQLTAPLSAPGLEALVSEAMGGAWVCRMEQSWLRKKFAPTQAPAREYHPQDWHQDGALGVRFAPQFGAEIATPPMTQLLTCWIPLNPCGMANPGLEFVRRRLPALLHFTELEDSALRQRFAAEEFWAPELALGDGLIFLNSVLHRTYAREEMRHNRLSVEYRIFPS